MNAKLLLSTAAAAGLILAGASAPAMAQNYSSGDYTKGTHVESNTGNQLIDQGALHNARKQVRNAIKVVQRMNRNPQLKATLAKAHGVYIVPNYSSGAFIVGGSGGQGVLLIHIASGRWSNPSFYHIGGISFGAQAGGSNGAVAFMLMSNQAVKHFMGHNGNTINLNARAGLTIASYSANTRATSAGDVIVWSNKSGAFAGAKIGGSGISWDKNETRAFYHNTSLTQDALFQGGLRGNRADRLQRALPNT